MHYMKDINENVVLLEKHKVFFERVFNGKFCYKYQVVGDDIIIVQRDTKEDAADEMVNRLKEIGVL